MHRLSFNGFVLYEGLDPIVINEQEDCYEAGIYRCYSPQPSDGKAVEITEFEPLPTVQEVVDAMTALFDATAQARRYDNRITCALRAGYAGPFQAEGQAFATWMDTCNALGYTMLAEVQAGTRPMPATVEDALALLPPMEWPE